MENYFDIFNGDLIRNEVENNDFKGADGVGIQSVVDNNDNTITITLTDGSITTYNTGAKGDKGDKGDTGLVLDGVELGRIMVWNETNGNWEVSQKILNPTIDGLKTDAIVYVSSQNPAGWNI